jgi:hypothetical protein
MISIVLYGRNDNYGYNLHKRAALSLNCMAEVLTDSSDEILFVDYNTPDDFPTFPEAIQDTLTRRAKTMLRILRVRPHVHERFKSKTRLLALEPIARNVAIRRSAASSRWILSTNTDMIFVPLRGRSLSEIARDLPDSFYHAPRLEIPEALWETLDRYDPIGIINTIREWGSSLYLNEIVLGSKIILYDGPGDFQLLLRSDLFENQGFHEEMLLGWHVDSNIAARMRLKYGDVGDIGTQIYGYHCDHTRQVTPAHSHTRVQNDWRRFVDDVDRADIPEQALSWGCSDEPIEEIRLSTNPAAFYVKALREVIGNPMAAPIVTEYTGDTYNKVDYDPRHLLPFLADMFVPMPRTVNVAWYGARLETLALFAAIWEKLGFTGKIFVEPMAFRTGIQSTTLTPVDLSAAAAKADTFVFDFGGILPGGGRSSTPPDAGDHLRVTFRRVIRLEQRRLAEDALPRRIIALNAINNEFEGLVSSSVAAAATPCATHMRHGFVLPAMSGSQAWLPLLGIGEAGIRVGEQIRSDSKKVGWLAYGPFRFLDEGEYRISLEVELLIDEPNLSNYDPCLFIEVRAGPAIIALELLRYGDLSDTNHKFSFSISKEVADGINGLETRVAALQPIAISLRALAIERTSLSPGEEHGIPVALRINDWLPFLRLGPLGRASEIGVVAEPGPAGFVVYGPSWSLPPGNYEMVAVIEPRDEAAAPEHVVRADVAVGNQSLVAANFHLVTATFGAATLSDDPDSSAKMLRVPFELRDVDAPAQEVETRIFSSGEAGFLVRSLSVRQAEGDAHDLLSYLLMGEVGVRAGGEVRNSEGRVGYLAFSPEMWLDPRGYRVRYRVKIQTGPGDANDQQSCATLLVRQGFDILAIDAITPLAGSNQDRELTFEIASERRASVEFLLRAVAAVNVSFNTLVLEPADLIHRPTGAVVCQIENWLPLLSTGPHTKFDGDGLAVSDGDGRYAVWGPYWTLPAGRYELIARLIPQSSALDGNPFVTIDISSEGGNRRFAEHEWRLGQIEVIDEKRAIECRLPFEISADLSAESRTIETRVYPRGNNRFGIQSVRVVPAVDKPKQDWFPYLTVGECGVYEISGIKGVTGKLGFLATTPTMYISSGRYRLTPHIVGLDLDGANGTEQGRLGLQIVCGSDIIAIGIVTQGESFEFDIADIDARVGVKLHLVAVTRSGLTIRGLSLERTSDTVISRTASAILQLNDWLPFLQRAASVSDDVGGVEVSNSSVGWVCWGPYWTLPEGRYDLIASIISHGPTPDEQPFIRLEVCAEGGQRRFAECVWRLGQIDPAYAQSARDYRLPFVVPAGLSTQSRMIETRFYTPGNVTFRICSVRVEHRSADTAQNWLTYLTPGGCGIYTGDGINSLPGKFGCIAETPILGISPGRHKLLLSYGAAGPKDVRSGARAGVGLQISAQSRIVAIGLVANKEPFIVDFEKDVAQQGIQLRLLSTSEATVSLRNLSIEQISNHPATSSVPAILRLGDWLPFLHRAPTVHTNENGLVIREGTNGFVCWGPNWELPPGHYQVVASIIPTSTSRGDKPIVTLDVTASGGERLLAGQEWTIGRFQRPDVSTAIDLALAFTLQTELSDVETRIRTSGEAGFQINSLIVRPIEHDSDRDWFPYLLAGECGVHTGRTINSMEQTAGCLAYTPQLALRPGNYDVILEFADINFKETTQNAESEIEIEVRSAAESLAARAYRIGSGNSTSVLLSLDITKNSTLDVPVQVFIRAVSPASIAICGLRLVRMPARVELAQLATDLPVKDWRSAFRPSSAALDVEGGVLARPGMIGRVGDLSASLAPGQYEIILGVQTYDSASDASGQVVVEVDGKVFASRQFGFNARRLGPLLLPRGPLRYCSFEVPAGNAEGVRIANIGIDNISSKPFLIQSVAVKQKTRLRTLRDQLQVSATKLLGQQRPVGSPKP